ncbi:MAG: MBL fold metallo-hydrolase [Desulfomonile tiedjei]|nr:MBL fold metallo-hydrolase [Desulfomonile tiedjei]
MLVAPSSADRSLDSGKSHHTASGFKNPDSVDERGFTDLLRWQWERFRKGLPPKATYNFPPAKNDPQDLKSNSNKTTFTWIGHATILLQLGGKNILTDPQFSQRASPLQWIGPKRVIPPGLALRDLPRIDIVVISHDHYDSLDQPTIMDLYNREGGRETIFFVPLGLKEWFRDLGITNVREMDWWDVQHADGLEIIAVPARHWSKRLLTPRNQTLWAGWVIRSEGFSFYFAGDSGYAGIFEEIGRRLGPFDLSAIPIGAYEPRWFMRSSHMNPDEAVRVHLDVRSKKSVGIHWGTFVLSDEPLDEPPKRLEQARKSKNLPDGEFVALRHGETIALSQR